MNLAFNTSSRRLIHCLMKSCVTRFVQLATLFCTFVGTVVTQTPSPGSNSRLVRVAVAPNTSSIQEGRAPLHREKR